MVYELRILNNTTTDCLGHRKQSYTKTVIADNYEFVANGHMIKFTKDTNTVALYPTRNTIVESIHYLQQTLAHNDPNESEKEKLLNALDILVKVDKPKESTTDDYDYTKDTKVKQAILDGFNDGFDDQKKE